MERQRASSANGQERLLELNYPRLTGTKTTIHYTLEHNQYVLLIDTRYWQNNMIPQSNMMLTHVIVKEHETDSSPTTCTKKNSLKTKLAQETTQITFEGGLLRNIPTTARHIVMNKRTKSIVIRNITPKNHRLNPLVSSNTNTTGSVIVSPTDNNTAHPKLSEW